MIRSVAEYVMRGRKQAVLVALLFTVIPLMGWVADAIVALVTLRQGAKEGAFVLFWVILPGTVLGLMGYRQIWLYSVVGGTAVTYVLALLLRHTGSWGTVLQIGAILGIVAVILAHIIAPDIAQVWAKDFAVYMQSVKQSSLAISPQEMQKGQTLLVKIATGLQVALLLLGNLFSLGIARWAQAQLYNPGGLQQELYNIRLGYVAIGILGVVVFGSIVGIDATVDSIPIVLLIFVIAGLSLVHAFFATKNQKFWIIVFYGLLVMLFPYMIGTLVMLALLDCGWNFRQRFSSKNIS